MNPLTCGMCRTLIVLLLASAPLAAESAEEQPTTSGQQASPASDEELDSLLDPSTEPPAGKESGNAPAASPDQPDAANDQPTAVHDQSPAAVTDDPSSATDPETKAKPNLSVGTGIEEIIVTATKREKSIRDIPASIDAFTGEELLRRGATDLKEILKQSPGVSLNDGAFEGSQSFSVRGITGGTNPGAGSQPTGFFFNEVGLTNPSLFGPIPEIDPFDLATLEVLKGPQGTLFGGSALSGALRFVRGAAGVGSLLKRMLPGRVAPHWYLVVLALPLLYMGSKGLGAWLAGHGFTFNAEMGLKGLLISLAWMPIYLMGQEVGWRGALQPLLQKRRSALRASVIVAIVWAFWHSPYYLNTYLSLDQTLAAAAIGTVVAPLFTIPITILMAWALNSTSGSIFIAMLFHGANNSFLHLFEAEGIGPASQIGGSVMTLFIWVLAIVVIRRYGGENLSRQPRFVLPES